MSGISAGASVSRDHECAEGVALGRPLQEMAGAADLEQMCTLDGNNS